MLNISDLEEALALKAKRDNLFEVLDSSNKNGINAIYGSIDIERSRFLSSETISMTNKALIEGIKNDIKKVDKQLSEIGVNVEQTI